MLRQGAIRTLRQLDFRFLASKQLAVASMSSLRHAPAIPFLPLTTRHWHSRSMLLQHERVFGFPFGLADHEELLKSYRSAQVPADAMAVLEDIEATARTERHALELEVHLQGKLAGGSEADRATYTQLAARTELWRGDIKRINLELHAEELRKQFIIYSPAEAEASGAVNTTERFRGIAGVQFDFEWSTARHASRKELAPFAFHARLVATPFTLEGNEGSAAERRDRPSIRLLDVTEADQSRVDVQALAELRQALAGGKNVSDKHFHWFLAFVCTHPTDLAFDVLSECLQRKPEDA